MLAHSVMIQTMGYIDAYWNADCQLLLNLYENRKYRVKRFTFDLSL